jgi:hypothetical protein
MKLNYEPLEKIRVKMPGNRVSLIVAHCHDKIVLDLGCYDETALSKRNTKQWLHQEIASVARFVLGIDNSPKIPSEGIRVNEKSKIIRGDALNLDHAQLGLYDFDLIVAGELIEHLPNTIDFFVKLKSVFHGKQLICSTPNATSLSNVLLGVLNRESAHHDHLQVYSYKTLNTLCLRAGFAEWEIIPYHVYFTEMILMSSGVKRIGIQGIEQLINVCEKLFPLLSGGLILNVARI